MNLHWSLRDNSLLSDRTVLELSPSRFNISAASFTTLASAGFGPGVIQFDGLNNGIIYDALNNWMIHRVVATDNGGAQVYDSFVAEMRATVGHVTYEVIADDWASRVKVIWTEVDPLHPSSTRDNSKFVPNTTVEAKYCIKVEDMDLTGHGTITNAMATQKATTFLADLIDPLNPSYDYRPDAPPESSLQLTLWGRGAGLDFQQDNTGYKPATELRTIAVAILQSTAGGVPCVQLVNTTDLTGLDTIGTTVSYNSGKAWKNVGEMLQDLAAFGNASNRRLLFQVWEDGKVYFKVRPLVADTFMRSDSDRVWDGAHAAKQPWMVRAGDYMLMEDFPAPLELFAADVDADRRARLIESTSYDDITGAWSAKPAKRTNPQLFWGRVKRGIKKVRG